MTDLIERFCSEYHDFNRIGADRRTMQRRVLREFDASVNGGLLEAGAGDLQSFLSSRLESGLKPSTVRRELHAVRPFFTWARRAKLIDADRLWELEDVSPPRGANGGGKPRPYKSEQIARFWRQLDAQYPLADEKWIRRWREDISPWKRVQAHAMRLQIEAVVWLALGGGLRRDEIMRQRLDELHPDNAVVVARSRKNLEAEWEERPVPMLEPMRDALAAWLEFRDWMDCGHDEPWLSLYRNYRCRPMRPRTFRLLLHEIGPRGVAGSGGWEFHRMRHTAATEMLRAGMPLHIVQRVMGHRRIQQTLAYAELLDGDMIEASKRSEARYIAAIGRREVA